MDTFTKVKEVIMEVLNVSEDKVTMDAKLVEDLSADSLDAVEIIMNLEDAYGVSVADDDASTIHTVSDLVNYIDAHKN